MVFLVKIRFFCTIKINSDLELGVTDFQHPSHMLMLDLGAMLLRTNEDYSVSKLLTWRFHF
jgi:hypothetical protein